MVYRRKFFKKKKRTFSKKKYYKKSSKRYPRFKKQVRLIKKVIQQQAELKQFNFEKDGNCMNGQWISISTTNFLPAAGTGKNERVGEKVFLKSMIIKLIITEPTRPTNLGEYSASYTRIIMGTLRPRPQQPILQPTDEYDYTVSTSRFLTSTLPADYYNELNLYLIPWRVMADEKPDMKIMSDKIQKLQNWNYQINLVDQYPTLQPSRTPFPIFKQWKFKMNRVIRFDGAVQRGWKNQLLIELHFPTTNTAVCSSPFKVVQQYYYTDI